MLLGQNKVKNLFCLFSRTTQLYKSKAFNNKNGSFWNFYYGSHDSTAQSSAKEGTGQL